MSNDKVAATFSGSDPALARTIEAAEIRGFACGVAAGHYHQRPTREDWAAARRWATNYGYRTQQETTGEHTQDKLADNLYGGATAEQIAEAWRTSQIASQLSGGVPGLPAEPAQQYSNQYLRDMAPEPADLAPAPSRGFFPLTAGEIQMGVVIVIAIIICFVLYAAVFRW